MPEGERRLVAIMFTDMVGYTALGQKNESLSLALVEEQRKLVRPILIRHNGREVKTIGDAFLVEFPSALDAVRCAYDIQRAVREFNVPLPEEGRIHLRVGLHLGDVQESEGDISGDSVNVASRIEPLAEDGGVCLTRQVYDHVSNKFDLRMSSLGPKELKNVREPVEVFKLVMPWEESASSETPDYSANRIAVLPFRNMSPDPNDEYFAEGMTEEVISTVSGISGLDVISRTSVMGYKGTTKKVEEIGKELKVGSVLEGSLRKAGNRIRVTTQLIEVARDRHLWSQNYDRDLDDLFAVQSDVAKQVADALRVKILTPEKERIEKKPTESATAYTSYLRGRYHWNKRGIEDIRRAAECFEQAVGEDPAFALGYVGLADSYELLSSNWGIDRESNHRKAESMVAKALEVDPELPEAHASKGLVLLGEFKLRDAETEFAKAIQLKPSYATAHQWYSLLLFAESRWDEAMEHIEKAQELDPFSVVICINRASYYLARRDYDTALDLYRKAVELFPENIDVHFGLAEAYGELKRFEDGRREVDIAVGLAKDSHPQLALMAQGATAYFEDDKKRMRELLPELEKHVGEPFFSSMSVANLYFRLGENDKGFQWLEHAFAQREFSILSIHCNESMDGVRTDPRYVNLVRKLGLS